MCIKLKTQIYLLAHPSALKLVASVSTNDGKSSKVGPYIALSGLEAICCKTLEVYKFWVYK